MNDEALKMVKEHALTIAALKATGLTFEELVPGIKVEPTEEPHPETWPLSFPAGLFPPECVPDVHPVAVLLWFFSDTAWESPDSQALASSYLTKKEHALAYSDGITTQRARRTGGRATAEERRQDAHKRHAEIVEIWHSLTHMPERNRAAVIAERLGCRSQHVRRVLRKANLR